VSAKVRINVNGQTSEYNLQNGGNGQWTINGIPQNIQNSEFLDMPDFPSISSESRPQQSFYNAPQYSPSSGGSLPQQAPDRK